MKETHYQWHKRKLFTEQPRMQRYFNYVGMVSAVFCSVIGWIDILK